MTACVCICPDSAEALRGDQVARDVSRRSAWGEESDHSGVSNLAVGATGNGNRKLSAYRQKASATGDAPGCEYFTLLNILCIRHNNESMKKLGMIILNYVE